MDYTSAVVVYVDTYITWNRTSVAVSGFIGVTVIDITRMWANAQRDGRPAEYRWRPLLNAAKFCSCSVLKCRAVMLPIGECKTWRTQSEFCTCKILLRSKKCIYSLPAQVTPKHRATFDSLPLSDVIAVTKPLRESRWNLLGCCKPANGSQLLVGRSLPYCEDMYDFVKSLCQIQKYDIHINTFINIIRYLIQQELTSCWDGRPFGHKFFSDCQYVP